MPDESESPDTGTAEPVPGAADAAQEARPPQGRARDLVRRRTGTYTAPETGRHHHIGAAPDRQPLLSDSGASYVRTAAVQLAQRTVAQLRRQHERHASLMRSAAQELDFEAAARERDALEAVAAELVRRGEPGGPPAPDRSGQSGAGGSDR